MPRGHLLELYHRGSYLVVCTDGPQLHDELEAEEVVGPDGLELQETAESHQLRSGQVVQSQLILKQFGEFHDLLITGTFPRVAYLRRKLRLVKSLWSQKKAGQRALVPLHYALFK